MMRHILSTLMVLICMFMIGTAGSAEEEGPFTDPILNEKAKEYAPVWEEYMSNLSIRDVAYGHDFTILVLKDGTIETHGAHADGTGYQQFNTNPWENITAVSTTDNEDIPILAGLCEDGTAVVTGRVPEEWNKALEGKHFKEVAAGYVGEPGIFVPADWYGVNYLACLQDDGRVWILYTADGNTMTAYLDWNDITAIAATSESFTSHLVGLKTDGTVVAAGNNQEGQCDVSGWRNIISIAVCEGLTVGVRSDGTVVTAGKILYGDDSVREELETWTDITAVSLTDRCAVGLRKDGTVAVAGENSERMSSAAQWHDIVRVSAGPRHIIGVDRDGKVWYAGTPWFGWELPYEVLCEYYDTLG